MSLAFNIFIWVIYFLSLYFSIFWFLAFLGGPAVKKGREPKEWPSVSVIVPAYNEEEIIKRTLESLDGLDYPDDRLNVIVVNDCSKDRTKKIVEEFIKAKPWKNFRLINYKINKGKGHALNTGLRLVEGEYFACLDADSIVDKQTLKKMITFFINHPDKRLAIVTPVMKVQETKTLLQKFQRAEYFTSMFLQRIMGNIDCLYVAPGPFSLYRTEFVRKIGGFAIDNVAEDQEIAYNMQKHNYLLKQCPDAFVYTSPPKKFGDFYRQRNRWFRGSLVNVLKYRSMMFDKKYGDFGVFQMPLNIFAFVLGSIGVFIFGYLVLRPLWRSFFDMVLIRFDIIPFLKTLQFSFDPLQIDIMQTFFITILLFTSILILYLSHKLNKDKVTGAGIIYYIPYFFFYYLILGTITIIVIGQHLVRRKAKW